MYRATRIFFSLIRNRPSGRPIT